MNYLKYAFWLIGFFLLSATAYCHHGGHYKQKQQLNNWHLANGKFIQGNFLSGNEQYIILEQLHGATITLNIKDLSKQHQLLARFKVNRLKSFNQSFLSTPAATQSNPTAFTKPIYLLLIGTLFIGFALFKLRKQAYSSQVSMGIGLLFLCCVSFINPIEQQPSKTNPSFIESAFAPFKPAVQTSWDDTFFHVASNGLPNHTMMVGIKSWQQQVPLPQNYTGPNQWSIPLQPVYAEQPMSTKTNFMRGAIALAVNGIPIFNPLNNRGDDAYLVGELDNWGGHCGRADDYHYHIAPMHLQANNNLPIAFALDGFAVYGSKEPDGTNMKALDACHGHVIGNSQYHYHGTSTYPYLIAAMKGKVNIDDNKPAPENQVAPQPNTRPIRPPQTPLRGAVIQTCEPMGNNGYLLTYQLNGKTGTVKYSWTTNGEYQFSFTDINGATTQAAYKKRNEPKP